MKSILKKLIVPVVALGISLTLWSCTTKENTKIIFDSMMVLMLQKVLKRLKLNQFQQRMDIFLRDGLLLMTSKMKE